MYAQNKHTPPTEAVSANAAAATHPLRGGGGGGGEGGGRGAECAQESTDDGVFV